MHLVKDSFSTEEVNVERCPRYLHIPDLEQQCPLEDKLVDVRCLAKTVQEPLHCETTEPFIETAIRFSGLVLQSVVDGIRNILERSLGHRSDSR